MSNLLRFGRGVRHAAFASLLAFMPAAPLAGEGPQPQPRHVAAGAPSVASREAYRNDRWPLNKGQMEPAGGKRQRWIPEQSSSSGGPAPAPVTSVAGSDDQDRTGSIVPSPRPGGPDMGGPAVNAPSPRARRWDVVPLPPARPW